MLIILEAVIERENVAENASRPLRCAPRGAKSAIDSSIRRNSSEILDVVLFSRERSRFVLALKEFSRPARDPRGARRDRLQSFFGEMKMTGTYAIVTL